MNWKVEATYGTFEFLAGISARIFSGSPFLSQMTKEFRLNFKWNVKPRTEKKKNRSRVFFFFFALPLLPFLFQRCISTGLEYFGSGNWLHYKNIITNANESSMCHLASSFIPTVVALFIPWKSCCGSQPIGIAKAGDLLNTCSGWMSKISNLWYNALCPHATNAISPSNQTLGFLKRHPPKASRHVKYVAYKSPVGPNLKYAFST